MIDISYGQKENIGFKYVVDLLEPCSAYGADRVRKLKPFAPGAVNRLEEAFDNIAATIVLFAGFEDCFVRLERVMRQVKDIRKSLNHCMIGVLGEVELFEIKRYLLQLEEIYPIFAALNENGKYSGISFEATVKALELLDPEGNGIATFFISGRYSAKLTAIRADKREIEERIRRESIKEEKAKLMAHRLELAAAEEEEEALVRKDLSVKLRDFIPALLHNAEAIGELDLTIQKAKLAKRFNACRPVITSGCVEFEEMINPQVCAVLERQDKSFTPVSLRLETGVTVITGANMGGKSVALKTAALNALLVQYGFFAFARLARTVLFDSVNIISEDLENTDRGLSSFGGEIVRFNEAVKAMNDGFSLLLMDEFARGTNPDEGAAIARAVVQFLKDKDVIACMTTHYDGIASQATAHYQVMGLKGLDIAGMMNEMAGLGGEDSVGLIAKHMNYGLYRVTGVEPPPRDALNICRLLGVEGEILNLAENNY